MKLYYFECDYGCGIRGYKTLKSAESGILREVGTRSFRLVREATEEDISCVKSMGGFIPKI